MKVDDEELRLVCVATLLLVLAGIVLELGPPLLAVPLLAGAAWAVVRLVGLLRRPDPWRVFEQALDDLGVTVLDDEPQRDESLGSGQPSVGVTTRRATGRPHRSSAERHHR